jgi:hypothetical protein
VIVIEQHITRLVQEAPARDRATVEALGIALRAEGSPLALAIARAVELVDDELVDPGVALPALAMACATLADPRAGDREREAARYEIDTLTPLPGEPPSTQFSVDIPVDRLISRVPRRRT